MRMKVESLMYGKLPRSMTRPVGHDHGPLAVHRPVRHVHASCRLL